MSQAMKTKKEFFYMTLATTIPFLLYIFLRNISWMYLYGFLVFFLPDLLFKKNNLTKKTICFNILKTFAFWLIIFIFNLYFPIKKL
ncbi:hypothetical protein CDB3_31940 [Bacillus sp. CDB3]|nr:hypothetical protein CDB3_31940 [Bacillus sp. CDB3]